MVGVILYVGDCRSGQVPPDVILLTRKASSSLVSRVMGACTDAWSGVLFVSLVGKAGQIGGLHASKKQTDVITLAGTSGKWAEKQVSDDFGE